MRKKKILIHSNFCKMFTGFGKHKKNLLKYLYKTGKYELIELSNGSPWSSPKVKSTPWESYGSLPDDLETQKEIASDESRKHGASYGSEMIDKAIYELKPDVYLGIEDIWAFRGFFDKPWWNKVHCIIHTTLDSLPILPDAVEAADKIKNYYVWASFAEKALNKIGHNHVKTIRGSIETQNFFRFDNQDRNKLRNFFGTQDNFIIGFVFRNQLRKSVPNLLDGFKIFTQNNPDAKAKLLLHTHWSEGWDILKLLKEKNIERTDILTTYFCSSCNRYDIKPFEGQKIKCKFCNQNNSSETTNVKNGVDERQLNEIYNLMDVYCHPFTSGGQELPIQEAKLTELVTLVTNYSCGEDCCTDESGGLPLDWTEYREPGTQFIKATTSPISISSQIEKVYKMPEEEKRSKEKKSRQFVLENYSIEKIGKQFEDLIDSFSDVEFDYKKEQEIRNIHFEPDNSLPDKEWVESLYENILGKSDPQGTKHWIHRLKTDLSRSKVIDYFTKVALKEKYLNDFEEFLQEMENTPEEKRIAYIEPLGSEEVIIATSVISSIKKLYPEHSIYFFTKTENMGLVDAHPDIKRTLNYIPKINDPLFLEGKGDKKGCFDVVYAPHLSIKNNYTRNNKDKLDYTTYESE
jgi:glycosyltransferase involved in cell wall biosynthesis